MPVLLDESTKYITMGNAGMPGTGFMILWIYTTNWDAATNAAVRAIMDQSNSGAIRNLVYVHSDNNTYTGWNLGQIVTDFSTAELEQETWTPILLTWDDAADEEILYVGDLVTPFAIRTAGFTAQALTGTMQIGRLLSTGYDLDAYVSQFARGSTVPDADQRRLLGYGRATLVGGLTVTQHVPLIDVVTATVGASATLEGGAAIAGSPPPIVSYTIAEYQDAIAAALTAAAGTLTGLGVELLPAYDMFTSEGITDWPAEFVQTGAYASAGTWTQSEADARYETRIVDGTSTAEELLTIAEANYVTQFDDGPLPAYNTSSVNHPENYARDAYAFVFGSAFAYTQGRILGDNSLSGKIGNWNTGHWPGDASNEVVVVGPGGLVSWAGKYDSAVTDLWKVLICESYHKPILGLVADGSDSNHPQARSRANYLLEHPECLGADDDETAWRLAGPVGAAHCASLLAVYTDKEYWTSFERSEFVVSNPTKASLEAEVFADNLTQMESAGTTGLWMFDINYPDGDAFGAATRAWTLELVQRYNQTGPYAPRTGLRNRNRRGLCR